MFVFEKGYKTVSFFYLVAVTNQILEMTVLKLFKIYNKLLNVFNIYICKSTMLKYGDRMSEFNMHVFSNIFRENSLKIWLGLGLC